MSGRPAYSPALHQIKSAIANVFVSVPGQNPGRYFLLAVKNKYTRHETAHLYINYLSIYLWNLCSATSR